MGITYIEGQVRGPTGKEETTRFLIDGGASYSLLPEAVWQAIELPPKREMSFTLPDGTLIERNISECYIVLPHGERHTPVVLGQADDEALLGVVTLEILGLVFNPFNRTLQRVRGMLA